MSKEAFNFSDPVRAAGQGVETTENNDNLPQFLFIALSDVNISQRNQGGSFMGEFPDEILPEKQLIVIEKQRAFAPNEIEAQSVDMVKNFYDPTLPTNEQPATMIVRNSAKKLARFVAREFEPYGVAEFIELVPHGEEAMREILSVVLPKGKIEPQTRQFEGIEQSGIFLDQLRDYLFRYGHGNVNKIGLTTLQKKLALSVLTRLNLAITRAWNYANEKLTNTHDQIRARANGSQYGKNWYDMPDARFSHRILPLDIVCLLETNTTPINLQQAESTNKMAQSFSTAVVEGFQKAMESPQAEQNENLVSLDDVRKMFEEQQKRHDAEMAEMKALIAGEKKTVAAEEKKAA